jgi:hypothetical protein
MATQTLDEVLVYNHLFSGSIEEKNRYESGIQFYQSEWVFGNEGNFSFITAMALLQRLRP